jgi:hypothetical protein
MVFATPSGIVGNVLAVHEDAPFLSAAPSFVDEVIDQHKHDLHIRPIEKALNKAENKHSEA